MKKMIMNGTIRKSYSTDKLLKVVVAHSKTTMNNLRINAVTKLHKNPRSMIRDRTRFSDETNQATRLV